VTEPTFTASIDRSSLSLDPLVLNAGFEGVWGVLPGWQMPGRQARVTYASSPYLHGDVATHWTWQHGMMSGDVTPQVDTPADMHAAVDALVAAIGRLSYEVTTTWNGVPTVWRCDPGSLTPSAVDYVELRDNQPVYSLSIPCYPLPVGGA
jgi:hypothetical protein